MSTKITVGMRQSILRKIMAATFDAKIKAIEDEEQKEVGRKILERNEALDAVLKPLTLEGAELVHSFIATTNDVNVRSDGVNEDYSIPFMAYMTKEDAENGYGVVLKVWPEYAAIIQKRAELVKQKQEEESRIKAVLLSVSSLEKLIEKVPEVESFIEMETKAEAGITTLVPMDEVEHMRNLLAGAIAQK